MKKTLAALLSAILLTASLCGCHNEVSETGAERFPDFSVGLAVGQGGVEDGSFNQSAYDAILEFQRQTGSSYTYTEAPKDELSYDAISSLAKEEAYNVVWCMGETMQEPLLKATADFPNQLFAIIDAQVEKDKIPKNLIVVNIAAEESSLLSGYIAGQTTKTNSLGFVKGMECPSNDAFEAGFRAGAYIAQKELSKKIDVHKICIDTFKDMEAAKLATEKLIDSFNTDIVHQCAGKAGLGAIEKCREAGIYAIGVDRDQSSVAPETVLTSSVKHVGSAIYEISGRIAKGEISGGENIVLRMDTGHTGIGATSDQTVPPEILHNVKIIEDKIKSRAVIAPSNENELNEFKSFVDKYFEK